jgi:hypothetical protein
MNTAQAVECAVGKRDYNVRVGICALRKSRLPHHPHERFGSAHALDKPDIVHLISLNKNPLHAQGTRKAKSMSHQDVGPHYSVGQFSHPAYPHRSERGALCLDPETLGMGQPFLKTKRLRE